MHGDVKWYDQPRERNGFLRAMIDVGAFDTGSDVVDFLEKPWHWEDEYELWVGLERPGDFRDPGWHAFDEAIAELSISAT